MVKSPPAETVTLEPSAPTASGLPEVEASHTE
jgi:hypothetical protein